MKTNVVVILSTISFLVPAAYCQSAATYYNVWSSGNMLYATAEIDGSMSASLAGITHTYTPTVSIDLPSFRYTSGSKTQTVVANSSQQIVASADIDVETDDVGMGGVYFTFFGTCSEAGNFLYATQTVTPIFSLHDVNYMLYLPGTLCEYHVFCPNGADGNVCAQQYPQILVAPDQTRGCLTYYKDTDLVITIFGVPECTFGVGDMYTTAQLCS